MKNSVYIPTVGTSLEKEPVLAWVDLNLEQIVAGKGYKCYHLASK